MLLFLVSLGVLLVVVTSSVPVGSNIPSRPCFSFLHQHPMGHDKCHLARSDVKERSGRGHGVDLARSRGQLHEGIDVNGKDRLRHTNIADSARHMGGLEDERDGSNCDGSASGHERADDDPQPPVVRPDLLRPNKKCKADQLSPTALAYVGDSVFELFVRCRYVWPKRRMSDLQKITVGVVRAETQAQLLSEIMLSFNVSKTEQMIMARGRNAGGKHSRGSAYQDATALEAFIGYIYITDPNRCEEVLSWLRTRLEEMDGST